MYFILIRICLVSLFVLFFSSCTQKSAETVVVYGDFPQTIGLKGQTVPLDTALFRYPFRIRVQGDRAVCSICMARSTSAMLSAIPASAISPLSASGERRPKNSFPWKISDGKGIFCGHSMPVNRN